MMRLNLRVGNDYFEWYVKWYHLQAASLLKLVRVCRCRRPVVVVSVLAVSPSLCRRHRLAFRRRQLLILCFGYLASNTLPLFLDIRANWSHDFEKLDLHCKGKSRKTIGSTVLNVQAAALTTCVYFISQNTMTPPSSSRTKHPTNNVHSRKPEHSTVLISTSNA